MNEDSYEFTLSRTEYRYEFVSISAKKNVRKVVLFSQTSSVNTYNLALLDLLDTGELSDMTETNNNDFVIVMATVFKIVIDFFDKLPGSNVVFGGSDDRRQRLYRIIIGRELEEITKTFDMYGIFGNMIEKFESNKIYDLYLIKKR